MYPLDVPGRPGKPEAIEVDQEHIKLVWTAPMSNGGSPIVGYEIERRERSTAGRWAKITRSLIKVNEFSVSVQKTDVGNNE